MTMTETKIVEMQLATKTLIDLLTGVLLATPKSRGLEMVNFVKLFGSGTGYLTAVATDGYRYHKGRVKVSTAIDWPETLISSSQARQLLAAVKHNKAFSLTSLSKGLSALTVSWGSGTPSITFVPSAWADYPAEPKDLFNPDLSLVNRIGVAPDFLADLAKIPRAKKSMLVLEFHGQMKAITGVIKHDQIDWSVALMPMRLPVTE